LSSAITTLGAKTTKDAIKTEATIAHTVSRQQQAFHEDALISRLHALALIKNLDTFQDLRQSIPTSH
jgi:hypothetical protein